MQSGIVSNRLILGVCAFSVSFGLSLVPNWNFTQALITGIITVLATYSAALFVDKRRRNYELLVLSSLHRKIRELESLKYRIAREVEQVQQHKIILYTESQQLQNQIVESRNQRDSLHRDIGNFAGQKKQLELEINGLINELQNIENSTEELKNYCAELTSEKRRLELNCNASRSEINQLQAQIEAFNQEKQEIENNLILSNRLKPQLEEKLYELRLEIQELDIKVVNQNNLLTETITTRKNLENTLTDLQTQKQTQQAEISQLQNHISLLQDERDLLQNQVWELLQNVENLHQEPLTDNIQESEIELFPFDELLEPINSQKSNSLPSEWSNFLENLPTYQIQVLKAIVEQDNPKAMIKQIAEAQITMPNLLIDGINEIANNTLGELIIETSAEIPEIYQEHLLNIKQIIAVYENSLKKSTSSN
ncbi:tellurite resistance TerB C-terminal domain-containing protein [Anabaena sp. UHCC 0451]|uniref:tellurite resistance TerB C-terminal domain-containing protein n=1 Tax=Anabaena sp. UHCC 0451 TaxID=2055235 RepID=UPI002B1FFC8B|nr:tellurite resistance TerB C-terminal domain-containing protein [Anabaena sp. UHCC 0451]MEA5578275.1 tellurite resistance TerB C-terminal domain-containing protein [Anabaena sp. UHCC 0451]